MNLCRGGKSACQGGVLGLADMQSAAIRHKVLHGVCNMHSYTDKDAYTSAWCAYDCQIIYTKNALYIYIYIHILMYV